MTTTIVRRAWIVGGSLLTAVALVWGTTQVVSALAHEEVTEVRTFPVEGVRLLDVSTGDGSVVVLGGDVEEIVVTAEISHGLRRTNHRAGLVGNVLEVHSSCPYFGSPWCEVDYRITVPADLAVTVGTSDGRLVLRDLTGDVRATSDNGSIEVSRLSGNLEVSTDNGSVEATGLRADQVVASSDNGRVELEFGAPPSDVVATSDNGRVEIVVPDTPGGYRVGLDTDNGSSDIGVPTDPESDRSIVARSDNGDIVVRLPSG